MIETVLSTTIILSSNFDVAKLETDSQHCLLQARYVARSNCFHLFPNNHLLMLLPKTLAKFTSLRNDLFFELVVLSGLSLQLLFIQQFSVVFASKHKRRAITENNLCLHEILIRYRYTDQLRNSSHAPAFLFGYVFRLQALRLIFRPRTG